MATQSRRGIPSVDAAIRALGETDLPEAIVADVVRRHLRAIRAKSVVPPVDEVMNEVRAAIVSLRATRLRSVVNGTGVVLHTNLGRAPLAASSVSAVARAASHYSNLEYSLATGARGERAGYLERGLAVLCHADAAAVVNNNAAALLLIVRHLCGGRASEVVISRGELLQIGGGFRIPDVLQTGGARTREVGTTNHTTLRDYESVIGPETACILRVHRSNFSMRGFVAAPTTAEVAQLARRRRVPLVEDLGSGAMVPTERFTGIEHEPMPAESIRSGADVACFSGDKLFGGPQAGIVVGRRRLVAGLKREPIYRALRCDKLTLAALEATMEMHFAGGLGVPVLDMMGASLDRLRERADAIVTALAGTSIDVRVGTGQAEVGGGTLPTSSLDSVTIDIRHATRSSSSVARQLRDRSVPVLGYVKRGIVKLDLRTVLPEQDRDVVEAIAALSA